MKNILKENMLRFGTKNLSESDKVKLSEGRVYFIRLEKVEKYKNLGLSQMEIEDVITKEYDEKYKDKPETRKYFNVELAVDHYYKYLENESPSKKKRRYAGYDQKTLDYIGSAELKNDTF